jgi:hypothetical protein
VHKHGKKEVTTPKMQFQRRWGTAKIVALHPEEVHAEGHFLDWLLRDKTLQNSHLQGENSILSDPETPPAKFFLFGKGKSFWSVGRFCSLNYYYRKCLAKSLAASPELPKSKKFLHRGRMCPTTGRVKAVVVSIPLLLRRA